MNDLDSMLSKNPPKPKRPLSASFTQAVIMGTQTERLSFWQKIRNVLPQGVYTKAGAASLAGIVLLSGSVAAIALWPTPSVKPTANKPLPSGNRIVSYDLNNCIVGTLDGKATPGNHKTHYEIRQNSSLTDQQIQDSMRALCEENMSHNAVSAIVKSQGFDKTPGMQSTSTYVINDITANSITVSLDPHYDSDSSLIKGSRTYTKFADNLILQNQGNKTNYDDFKAGDSVKLIVQDTSGKSSETAEQYVALNHPEHINILAMIKVPALTADPNVMLRAFATDIVRVEPCAESASGFCRVYDFADQN